MARDGAPVPVGGPAKKDVSFCGRDEERRLPPVVCVEELPIGFPGFRRRCVGGRGRQPGRRQEVRVTAQDIGAARCRANPEHPAIAEEDRRPRRRLQGRERRVAGGVPRLGSEQVRRCRTGVRIRRRNRRLDTEREMSVRAAERRRIAHAKEIEARDRVPDIDNGATVRRYVRPQRAASRVSEQASRRRSRRRSVCVDFNEVERRSVRSSRRDDSAAIRTPRRRHEPGRSLSRYRPDLAARHVHDHDLGSGVPAMPFHGHCSSVG